MLKHVIVPLDGSQLAQSALDYALKLLGEQGKITLVTVLQQPDVPIYDFYPVTVTPQVRDYEVAFGDTLVHARDYLKRLADDIHATYAYQVETVVEVGDAASLIVEAAAEYGVDAIVMSTHGRSGLSRWLFGSVTQKVLAASGCPMFVIPAKACEEAKSPNEAKKAAALPN